MSEWIKSGRGRPCPVCERVKDGDCRWQGEVVLCHTHQQDTAIDGWKWCGHSDSGAGWGKWVKPWQKPAREAGREDYTYQDRSGKALIRVCRVDDGKGNKKIWQEHSVGGEWRSGCCPDKFQIPIYRYYYIRRAIEAGEPIFLVEGEGVAEALVDLGMAATTTIGGSKGYRKYGTNYKQDLEGAKLILCPDRDLEGMAYIQDIQKDFPDAAICKAFPLSPEWNALPKAGGPDLKDWIEAGATKEQILAAVQWPKQEESQIDDELLERVNRLARNDSQQLDLRDFLDPFLADPLMAVARAKPTSPEMLLTTGLAVWASLIGASSEIELKGGQDPWREPSVLWTMNVARTGSLKTATQKVLIKPLQNLQREANRKYREAFERWKEDKREFERSKGEGEDPGPEPAPREYYVSDLTMEALGLVHQDNPRGFLMYKDEIDGWFSSFNKYRAGDDEQNWLSLNGGGGIKVNRIDRSKRMELHRTSVSITGSIQPETLSKHLGGDRDTSGMNARWLYCAAPMPIPTMKLTEVSIDVDQRLEALYDRLSRLPCDDDGKEHEGCKPLVYRLSAEARNWFAQNWNDPIVDRWRRETNPAFAGVLSKMKGYCGRIALILHLVNQTCRGAEAPDRQIELSTIQQAIKLSEYFLAQAELIFTKSEKKPEDLSPVLLRLIEISKRVGWISARDARRQTSLIKSSEEAVTLFRNLVQAGIGQIDESGRSIKWFFSKEVRHFDTLPETPSGYGFGGVEVGFDSGSTLRHFEPNTTIPYYEENPSKPSKCRSSVEVGFDTFKSIQGEEYSGSVEVSNHFQEKEKNGDKQTEGDTTTGELGTRHSRGDEGDRGLSRSGTAPTLDQFDGLESQGEAILQETDPKPGVRTTGFPVDPGVVSGDSQSIGKPPGKTNARGRDYRIGEEIHYRTAGLRQRAKAIVIEHPDIPSPDEPGVWVRDPRDGKPLYLLESRIERRGR